MSAQSEALRLAEWLEGDGGGLTTLGDCAAELRRLSSVEAELLAMRRVFSEAGCTFDVNYIRRLVRAEAQRDALLEALKSTGLFLHHCWCDVQMNDYSFEKLNQQMAVVDAAIKAVEGENA